LASTNFIPLSSLFAARRPDAAPVCHDGERLVHWGEFSARVAALCGHLHTRPELRWLLTAEHPLQFAIELFALLGAGKQVVIPPNTQPGTLAALAASFDARLPDAASQQANAGSRLPVIEARATVIDLYTSGSTGEAKRIRKSLAQLDAEVAVLEALWGEWLGASAVLATVPHQHIYGLLFRLLWPLAAGRVFDALTCTVPEAIGERIAVLGDACLVSSPAQLGRMPELLDLSSLTARPKAIFSSGGALPAAAAGEFRRNFGQAPSEVFGSTETGGIAWRRQDGTAGGELWTPFPGLDVGRSEHGALLLRSPFLGDDGVFTMDDGIELAADGRFRLLGRLDRTVKIEEKRLSLPEMERVLDRHAWVQASAAVALAGRRQRIGIAVVLSGEGSKQLATLGQRAVVLSLRRQLAPHFDAVLLPRHWRFPQRLPLNERGKLSPAALAELFSPPKAACLYPEIIAVSRTGEGGDAVVLDLRVDPAVEHFSGHFPGLPILPGVVQVDWAIRYARQYLALSGPFSLLENLKFLAIVQPDAKLQLALRWHAGTRKLDFSYATSERKFSAGRIVFGGADAL
jgi:acyl-CoA synthetase (AMP-forming)/AMP-acid ligase II/3-hydroxymyristoyl/3-hydroxydecanoyl-(acyl carrier protein) dehydratase